ncbi:MULTISPECIES: hypothetical protein [Streptomyces]|uniref:Uncharacterized protein n=1 Tax=Streptomyces canarius TaxID=285453 RepID=A0ABQ3D5I8_9ACTN|nr:hypothetical protein [Streptomyces canarius]GHA57885.1 hypothetical protein GCM10010345_72860 [Streptomyces canarius]
MPADKIDMGGEKVTGRLVVVFGAAVEPDSGVRAGDGPLDVLPPAHGQVARRCLRELLGSRKGEDARQWPGIAPEYAEQLLSMTDTLLSGPATSSARTRRARSAA